MPVRIYEIAKKYGLESKEILAAAKKLNIPHARVASSTLDIITAKSLEEYLVGSNPLGLPTSTDITPGTLKPIASPGMLPLPKNIVPSRPSLPTIPSPPAEAGTAAALKPADEDLQTKPQRLTQPGIEPRLVKINSRKTLRHLARLLGVDLQDVSNAAKATLGLSARQARDKNYWLSIHQCRKIQDALEILPKPDRYKTNTPVTQTAPVISGVHSSAAITEAEDKLSQIGRLKYGQLNHDLWLSYETLTEIEKKEFLQKRLSIVLQHLGTNGRTSIVKGCKNKENKGWLRSPLGGNNGVQYYLWWTCQGNQPVKHLDLSPGAILVRAVRHHDNHDPLLPGTLSDYFNLSAEVLQNDPTVGHPWTDDQLKFVESADPVRIILGTPGSGKTAALWKAIDVRGNQKVLYLTWSGQLTERAMQHFRAFAPADVRVVARDFITFLGELCLVDIQRLPLAQSQYLFAKAMSKYGPRLLGAWHQRQNALHAEIRAFLLGRALPGVPDQDKCVMLAGIPRLSDASYLKARGDVKGVGQEAASRLLEFCAKIETQEGKLKEIFPELEASARAIERLRNNQIPAGFADLDRIVIDEIQDLTLLEILPILELCLAIARSHKNAPCILIAGDEGQTVRPSGFEWGPLKNLLARIVAPPTTFQLEDNLRCPDGIAKIIARASDSYARLNKAMRPGKQSRRDAGPQINAYLFYVEAKTKSEAIELLTHLNELDVVKILSPCNKIPAWVPDLLRDSVLTPDHTKGLEYQNVCLLDAGRYFGFLDEAKTDVEHAELHAFEHRTAIDQLRVSLSRSTETIVFIDAEPTEKERERSLELLGEAAVVYDPDDLVDHFIDSDISPEERVNVRINDAEHFLQERPQWAWRRACQAVRLLGDPNFPNGVSSPAIRQRAYDTLLATACQLLVSGVPEGLGRKEVVSEANFVLGKPGKIDGKAAFNELEIWTRNRRASPFQMLETAGSLGMENTWLKKSLAPVYQELRHAIEHGATVANLAPDYEKNVEEWLRLLDFPDDITGKAMALRCQAVDTLIRTRSFERAERVLAKIKPDDVRRLGQLREAQGRFIEAAEAFERAGAVADAVRSWRNAALWHKAVRLAEGSEKEDLEWLIEVENLANKRPINHQARMTEAERKRLLAIIENSEDQGHYRSLHK